MGVSQKSRRRERGVHEPTSAPLRTGESRASAQSARTEPSISSGSSAETSTPLHAIGKPASACHRTLVEKTEPCFVVKAL